MMVHVLAYLQALGGTVGGVRMSSNRWLANTPPTATEGYSYYPYGEDRNLT
jgi:hypothetical protein